MKPIVGQHGEAWGVDEGITRSLHHRGEDQKGWCPVSGKRNSKVIKVNKRKIINRYVYKRSWREGEGRESGSFLIFHRGDFVDAM